MPLKPVSAEVRKQLDTLQSARKELADNHGRLNDKLNAEAIAVLRQIGQSRVSMVIPELFWWALEAPRQIRVVARTTIEELSATIAPADLPVFDQWMRTALPGWSSRRREQVAEFTEAECSVPMLGMLSMQYNGFVREAAVKELAKIHDSDELRWLLVRLHDWVEVIRKRACAAVLDRISQENATALVRLLPLILRMKEWESKEARQVFHLIGETLKKAECEPALRNGLEGDDGPVARACLHIIGELAEDRAASLLAQAWQSADPWIRFRAAKRLLALTRAEQLLALCSSLAKDRYVPVRRVALEVLAEQAPELAENHLRKAMVDRHSGIRQLACFWLEKQPGFDSASFYREKIGTEAGPNLAVALRGIGETGQPDDLEILRPWLHAKNDFLRKAALIAATRLSPREVMDNLMLALADESEGISRTARQLLTPHARALNPKALGTMLQNGRLAHVRRNAFRLVLRIAKWDQLPLVLGSLGDVDAKVANMAEVALATWLFRYNYSFVTPAPIQLVRVEEMLAKVKHKLDDQQYKQINRLIADWKIP